MDLFLKKIYNLLKRILPVDRYVFQRLNRKLELHFDYRLNRDAVTILESIWLGREYAPWFPFERTATVVDIGAHYGYFSIFASRNLAAGSRILALEPAPDNFQILRRNIEAAGCLNIQPLPLALGKCTESRSLFLGPSYNHSFFGKGQERSIEIQTISLDDLIREQGLSWIDFLKLDCEGAEYEVLLNTSAETLQKIQVISLEFHPGSQAGETAGTLVDHLQVFGFRVLHLSYDKDYSLSNMNFGKLIMGRSETEKKYIKQL